MRIGANYRSRISGTTLDDYAGLFAEGGDLDAPESWGLGVAFEVTPQLTIAADYQRINYSDVDSVGNSFDNLFVAQQTGDPNFLLGGKNGPGFGWDDINMFKIGLQYQASNEWTWRVGYNHGDNPIDSDEVLFNILAPGVMEDHLTAGFTKMFGDHHELNFAAMYAPEESVSGTNPLDGQELEIEMQQFELEVGYAYRF